jgi:hypothetical protein
MFDMLQLVVDVERTYLVFRNVANKRTSSYKSNGDSQNRHDKERNYPQITQIENRRQEAGGRRQEH